MKVLVTGAAGFIGSYVARALLRRGVDVVGIDNFNDYYKRECKEFNVDLIRLTSNNDPAYFSKDELFPVHEKLAEYSSYKENIKSGSFKFIEGDIVDKDFIFQLFQKEKIEAVIHLAAMAGVPLSTKIPLLYTNVNVDGTMILLDACRNNGVRKFVFGSSSSVYGNREDKKVSETDDVMHAVSPYGASKVAGEVLCHSAHAVYGIDVTVVRIFGPIYGPLQRPYGMLMQRAINYTHNDKVVEIYGRKGLDSAKDSTYIDDEVTGILLALNYEGGFEVFNIGTSNPKSIREWFSAIEKAYGKPVPYKIVDIDKGDVASSADISKAERILGYQPSADLYESVQKQVEVFKLMPSWYQTLPNV